MSFNKRHFGEGFLGKARPFAVGVRSQSWLVAMAPLKRFVEIIALQRIVEVKPLLRPMDLKPLGRSVNLKIEVV